MSEVIENIETLSLFPTALASLYLCNKFMHPQYRSKPNYRLMATFLFVLLLFSTFRLFRTGQLVSEADLILYKLSIDFGLLSIAVFNLQTLGIFSILDPTITKNKFLLDLYLGAVITLFCLKQIFAIVLVLGIYDFPYRLLLANLYLGTIIAEDNIQGIYLSVLLYSSIHKKRRSREARVKFLISIGSCLGLMMFDWLSFFLIKFLNPISKKGDNDLCFNVIFIHCICLTAVFHHFRNLAAVKIKARLIALESENYGMQVVFNKEAAVVESNKKCYKSDMKVLKSAQNSSGNFSNGSKLSTSGHSTLSNSEKKRKSKTKKRVSFASEMEVDPK
ncbi:hypothetical protein HDV06_002171 [Boothiomyces sp. JEL0866]|nr:hypothetical protein HDV06_002171 [Boothiomyces sp. JEL0866]